MMGAAMNLPYYDFTSAQWNAFAVALQREAANHRAWAKVLDADVAEALERAKVAHRREAHNAAGK